MLQYFLVVLLQYYRGRCEREKGTRLIPSLSQTVLVSKYRGIIILLHASKHILECPRCLGVVLVSDKLLFNEQMLLAW